MSERLNIVEDRADWLVDAIAMSTQNRMFLRGDPEEDAVATEAILLCSKQALAHVEAAYRARVAKLEAALKDVRIDFEMWHETTSIAKIDAALKDAP